MASEPIYVVCDRCGKPTPCGISADLATIQNPTNVFRNNRTKCPHCEVEHWILWSKAELWPESVALGKK